jgi:predicted GNAT superfamily acetyltransferase
MGLNDSYMGVRSNTLLQDPLPTLKKAYSLVLRHEKQSKVTVGKSHAQLKDTVFAIRNSNHEIEAEPRCSKCNKTNHTTKDCRAHLRYTFCHLKGHTTEYCRKKKAVTKAEFNAIISKGNQVASHKNERKEVSFPFTVEECQQILSMLKVKQPLPIM